MIQLNGWDGPAYTVSGVVVGKEAKDDKLIWLLEDGSWHEYEDGMSRSNEKLSVLYLQTYHPITAGDCALSLIDGFKGEIQLRPNNPIRPS